MIMEAMNGEMHRMHPPMIGYMRIVEINGRREESKRTEVIITFIGINGLRFESLLRLPKNENVIWCFQMEVGGAPITMEGIICESRAEVQSNEYEVRWTNAPYCKGRGLGLLFNMIFKDSKYTRALRSYQNFDVLLDKKKVDLIC